MKTQHSYYKEKAIRIVHRKELNIKKYDALVARYAEETTTYQQSWYLDAISDNWFCIVLDDYKAVFPVAYTIKAFQKIIYQPFFSREFNVVGENLNQETKKLILSSIPKQYKKIDFCTATDIQNSEYQKQKAVYQYIELPKNYDEVYKNYSQNTRRILKKTKANSIEIKQSDNVKRFISFFKIHTGKQVDYASQHYNNLEQVMTGALRKKKGKLLIAQKDNTILAQGFFLTNNNEITYLKGSVTPEGKKTGAMFALMDKALCKSIGKFKVFDFGGSRIESIARFYKKFGAKDKVYFHYTKNELPLLLKKGKKIKELFKK